MKNLAVFALFGMMLIVIIIISGTRPIAVEDKPTLIKGAEIQVTNGNVVDIWEYKSNHLNCLISVTVYATGQASFTQTSCK